MHFSNYVWLTPDTTAWHHGATHLFPGDLHGFFRLPAVGVGPAVRVTVVGGQIRQHRIQHLG